MKKIYLSLALFASLSAVAQKMPAKKESFSHDRTFVTKAKISNQDVLKAEGDTLWMSGFETAGEWVQTLGSGQSTNTGSNPGWELLTALPSNVTAQQASYQWPATFSGATGNFAFINSDAAGASGTQDAYFETAADIDLSAAGSAALYLTFSEYYRNFLESTYVEVSIDGGTNWTIFEVNPESEVPVNTNAVPGEVEVVNITSAIGSGTWTNQVRVRFHYVGAYDWFWGVDDVKIVEAWDNDVKINNWYAATDVATTQGLDYYTIDNSQTSFPGLTFGAIVNNNGAQNQASVALRATATGGYDQTGTSISLNASASDSVAVTSPYIPTGVGVKTINLATVIAGTDSAPANNTVSLGMELTTQEYSRDNGVSTGSISNTTNNTGNPLKIGNIMDIFNDWSTTGAVVRLNTQAAGTAGAEYWVEAFKFDGTDYIYSAETERKTISGTAASWQKLKWVDGDLVDGKLNFTAGDDILLLACHNGGTSEVRFGMAQNTYEGSVLGFTGDGTAFRLSSPGAIMVRLTDDPTLSVNEMNEVSNFSVSPNPASEVINVKLNNADNAVITISDLTGKVISTTTSNGISSSISTSGLNSGVYMVNVTVGNTTSTQKVVIKK
ncbi:MAG: T9SS type A sorting domain-containing protein [Flavobacteriales bacterium]|nr:T9SS type A sorting domain-containing protein [Flavobacteriales bacterium]